MLTQNPMHFALQSNDVTFRASHSIVFSLSFTHTHISQMNECSNFCCCCCYMLFLFLLHHIYFFSKHLRYSTILWNAKHKSQINMIIKYVYGGSAYASYKWHEFSERQLKPQNSHGKKQPLQQQQHEQQLQQLRLHQIHRKFLTNRL